MTITLPRPRIFGPKVPGVLVIGLLAAQFAFFGSGNSPETKCTLNVERPHHSTYLKEYKQLDAIKLNITSSCNVPQTYTQITSSIFKIENNQEVIAHNFPSTRAYSSLKSNTVAIFEGLFVQCKFGLRTSYSSAAKGFVMLKGGQKYPVSGFSGKFEPVLCQIGAQ